MFVCLIVLIGRWFDSGLPWNEYFWFRYLSVTDSIVCSGLSVNTTSSFCYLILVKVVSDKRSTLPDS